MLLQWTRHCDCDQRPEISCIMYLDTRCENLCRMPWFFASHEQVGRFSDFRRMFLNFCSLHPIRGCPDVLPSAVRSYSVLNSTSFAQTRPIYSNSFGSQALHRATGRLTIAPFGVFYHDSFSARRVATSVLRFESSAPAPARFEILSGSLSSKLTCCTVGGSPY